MCVVMATVLLERYAYPIYEFWKIMNIKDKMEYLKVNCFLTVHRLMIFYKALKNFYFSRIVFEFFPHETIWI